VAIKRGDVIVAATAGDFGKPRPALVIQSDLFNPTHSSLVICPITSHLLDAPLFRSTLKPTSENGLKTESQLMIDKLTAVKRERIGKRIGQLSAAQMTKVDDVLRMWLELGNTV
jgi:mRNA interferase MazF